jgi:hypothetical protein
MPSEKEQCFEDALAEFKRAFPDKDPKVEMFKEWYRDLDKGWQKAGFVRSFSHWIGSILKTQRIVGGEEDPRPDGAPNPTQWRTPDISASDGKVYDLKFTNAQGKVDPWGDKPGMGGGNQKEDQAAINKQVDEKSGAMSLDKDSCKCEERGEPQPVEAPAKAPFFVPGINPTFPLTQPGGAAVPEAIPELIPAMP